MALFKGKRDDERVSAAGDALLAGKVAKGVGGQVSIDGDWLTISHKGALGKTTHGLAGEKRVPIANVTAVRMKEPGMTNGYITFSMLGNVDQGRGVVDAAKDENSVVFSKFHLAEFVAIKRHIEDRIASGLRGGNLPAPAAIDRVDQLKRLAELRTAGVLTEDEFAAEKAKILGGS